MGRKGGRRSNMGEKLEFTRSLKFDGANPSELGMMKSHIGKSGGGFVEESEYEIEEIPIYTSEEKARLYDDEEIRPMNDGKDCVLPPINGHSN